MNRFKKEEQQQKKRQRDGLTVAQCRQLDQQQADDEQTLQQARELHAQLFDEEYAFMYADSFGTPQLNSQQIAEKNQYRQQYQLPLLDNTGRSDEFQAATMQHCIDIIRQKQKS